ncbi:F-box only protein 5 [Scophthalmus maximus]|uniref:F-box protein 5 n=1 Tax=Scophthalmus maximus TaxID=52904 RepID=A0A6A4SAF5_SCOMX|nr:F-box only protein 5 [Scophthalmus maximus]KAF0027734.1 hypothetical protein F2P81_020475 [Scophthalmus maximus]
MKCPRFDTSNMEKSCANVAAAEARVLLHIKASPVKEPTPVKPQCPPAAATTRTLFSLNNDTRPVHNKENSAGREHDRTLHEAYEDSGYLSLHNSQIDGEEDDDDHHVQGKPAAQTLLLSSAVHQERTTAATSPHGSPSKCQGRKNCPASLVAASTPVDRPRRRILSSTPADNHSDTNLPILKFQRAVCEKLAESYRKNKKYDWSVVSKVAEDHLLDRVIGGKMGQEYVDVFASLLSRNMKSILSNILGLLGDMDLISCRRVSRTWRKIICEDRTALDRCHRAEEALRESMSSLRQRDCGLTRDIAMSRVVLSCMQTRASSSTPSSSSSSSSSSSYSPSCRVNRRTSPPLKGSTPNSQCTRFNAFVQAANGLKQHESLRSCKRCGSPATHSSETRRARCARPTCLFDFCTCCQEAYHGSAPCRTVEPRPHFLSSSSRASQILPGTTRSKKNLRRL